MANTLTGLIPTLYEALDTVSREFTGMIPAVNRNSNAERAAVGQNVRVPIAQAGELEDIVAGVAPKDSGDTNTDHVDVTIEHSKAAPIKWNGEEILAVNSNGVGYNKLLANQFTDGMRKLVNAMEADIAHKALLGASLAHGTKGKAPFGTAGDLDDFAQAARLLDENGTPISDRQLVLNSTAMANLRGKQSVLFKVNEAGSEDMLRTGYTDRVQNFALRYSGGISQHVAGNGTGYTVSGSAAQGLKSLPLAGGSNKLLAGDIVEIDGVKYIVGADVNSTADTLKLNGTGLKAVANSGATITPFGSFMPNFAFDRNAIVLAARAPAVPQGGDSADDAIMLTDPLTGLVFEVRVYRQYRQVKYEVSMAWGAAVIKPEHLVVLAH